MIKPSLTGITYTILLCIVGGLILWRWFIWVMKQEEKGQGKA